MFSCSLEKDFCLPFILFYKTHLYPCIRVIGCFPYVSSELITNSG